jgi:hypothetical protein
MSKYLIVKQWKVPKFKRRVGINKGAFEILSKELEKQIEEDKKQNPKSKRGVKSTLCIEDQLLLFLFYLRSYKTFLELGDDFTISEGYANKVFHKICKRMIRILKLPANTELSREGLKAVVIDASEQPIERPVEKQKSYYSGKKTPYDKSTVGNMSSNTYDSKS